MNEMDLLARMRDNAPRRVSARVEQMFHAALYENHYPKRARPAPRLRRLAPRGATGSRAGRPGVVLPSRPCPRSPSQWRCCW